MLRWTLLSTLIAISVVMMDCAGHAPAPPATERCLTLKDHLRCRAADGKHFSEPYPGHVMRECRAVSDAEAQANFTDALKR